MPPIWKIKREFKNFFWQMDALTELVFAPLRQYFRDPRLNSLTTVTDGLFKSTAKVAIFLIYQPKGIPSSVVATCHYLSIKRYSIVLVSNHKLQSEDLRILSPLVWRFVERQNYGYDFGGYRDGIRLLWSWSIRPDSLLIINDSIWFPLCRESNIIELMEASPAEFVGAIRYVDSESSDFEGNGFFQSYFLMVKKLCFFTPAFIDFWKKYIATSNKYITVRRGERGFSKKMFASKISNEAIFSRDRFMEVVRSATIEQLRLTLKYAAYIDDDLHFKGNLILNNFAESEVWRKDAINHVQKVSNKRNFHFSFCYGTIGLMGISFLKKSGGVLQDRMRNQYLAAVAAGDLKKPYNVSRVDFFCEHSSNNFSNDILDEIKLVAKPK